MSGLDKILAEIRDEAAAEAKQTLDTARAQADKVLAQAKEDSQAQADKVLTTARQDVADIERSRESALALQRRQRTLSQKQALLAETLQKAQDSIKALPEGEYFDLLVRLAKNAAEPGEGVLLLNDTDKKRVPADFAKKVADALPSGASLSISDETRDIDGGFVLKYGDVEENCSIGAMFNARADEFSDLVRDTLFG